MKRKDAEAQGRKGIEALSHLYVQASRRLSDETYGTGLIHSAAYFIEHASSPKDGATIKDDRPSISYP